MVEAVPSVKAELLLAQSQKLSLCTSKLNHCRESR